MPAPLALAVRRLCELERNERIPDSKKALLLERKSVRTGIRSALRALLYMLFPAKMLVWWKFGSKKTIPSILLITDLRI